MSIAILVMNNGPLEDLYTLNLRLYVGVDVIPKKNAIDAIGLLQHLPKVDLILTMDKIGQESSAELIYQYLKGKNISTPMIVFSKDSEWGKRCLAQLPVDSDLKSVVKSVAKVLKVTSKDMVSQVVPDFYPMDIKYFQHLEVSICDAFVQVKQDQENYQYAKVFDANIKVDRSVVGDFIKRGIGELYVPSTFRLKFVNEFSKQLVQHLQNQNLTTVERLEATQYAQEFVYRQFRALDFEDDTVNLAKESIESLLKVVSENPKLEELLGQLMSNQGSFHFKHCQLCTYICTHIVKNMDWGSSEQTEKLAFVSFFHDIFLTTDEQVKIGSDEELESSKLTPEEQALVKKHAYMASDLICKMPQAPFGADTIIKEHHGNRNGIGLNPSFASNISPLAMVFMIAEEYACGLLGSHGKTRSHDELLRLLYKKFDRRPKYLAIIRPLEKLKRPIH